VQKAVLSYVPFNLYNSVAATAVTFSQQFLKQPIASQSKNPIKKKHLIFLQGAFYIQCKQGGGATVLREG
jgi:hypothetical protein